MIGRRHWIPPLGLAFGQLCQGASWILGVWIALGVGVGTISLPEIAWVHLVALGWLTTTALSILLHAIPAFLEVRWRSETVARTALSIFGAAVVALVVAMLIAPGALLPVAIALGSLLTIYLATAWATLVPAFRSSDRIDRAVARAFASTLFLLFVAMLLGVASSSLFSTPSPYAWIARLPPAHAGIALFGWLTLFIYGVSARTLRPITGNRSRRPVLHIVSGTATLVGALLLAAGAGATIGWLAILGGIFIALGAAAYVADVSLVLLGATVTYRLSQCFIAAALFWLLGALSFGGGVLIGKPWEAPFVFLMLAGWAGQMMNGHIFHIGVRLIATIYRGDDDETEPRALLHPRQPWLAFAAMQLAVAVVAYGLVARNDAVTAAGSAIGTIAWVAMIVALAQARTAARR